MVKGVIFVHFSGWFVACRAFVVAVVESYDLTRWQRIITNIIHSAGVRVRRTRRSTAWGHSVLPSTVRGDGQEKSLPSFFLKCHFWNIIILREAFTHYEKYCQQQRHSFWIKTSNPFTFAPVFKTLLMKHEWCFNGGDPSMSLYHITFQ